MNMISYWKDTEIIYVDDGLVLIVGWYNHKNENANAEKELGVHWGTYPQSRGVLSPCIIPEATRNAILSGLLHTAVSNKKIEEINSIIKAIEFFNN